MTARLGDLPIGKKLGLPGRTGAVYECGKFDDGTLRVVKCFKTSFREPLKSSHVARLVRWRTALAPSDRAFLDMACAWPREVVVDSGVVVGFLMPKAPDCFWQNTLPGEYRATTLDDFRSPDPVLRTEDADWLTRLRTLDQYVEVVKFFEARRVVYPDLSGMNVLWTTVRSEMGQRYPRIFLLDCDSSILLDESIPKDLTAGTRGWADLRNVVDSESGRYSMGMFFLRACLRSRVDSQAASTVMVPADCPVDLAGLMHMMNRAIASTVPRPSPRDWQQALATAEAQFPTDEATELGTSRMVLVAAATVAATAAVLQRLTDWWFF